MADTPCIAHTRISSGKKHRGKTFKWVFEHDQAYVGWAVKLPCPTGPLAPFVRFCQRSIQNDLGGQRHSGIVRRRSRTPPRKKTLHRSETPDKELTPAIEIVEKVLKCSSRLRDSLARFAGTYICEGVQVRNLLDDDWHYYMLHIRSTFKGIIDILLVGIGPSALKPSSVPFILGTPTGDRVELLRKRISSDVGLHTCAINFCPLLFVDRMTGKNVSILNALYDGQSAAQKETNTQMLRVCSHHLAEVVEAIGCKLLVHLGAVVGGNSWGLALRNRVPCLVRGLAHPSFLPPAGIADWIDECVMTIAHTCQ